MSNSLIAQSDTTRINLTLENKINITKTLIAYPLLLDNLDLKNNLLDVSDTVYNLQSKQLEVKDNQLLNLEAQIKALESEKQLFKFQLRKQKGKSLKIGGIGLLTIATILLIK